MPPADQHPDAEPCSSFPLTGGIKGGEQSAQVTLSSKLLFVCPPLFPLNSLIAVFLKGDRETESLEKWPQNQALRAAAFTYQAVGG